MANGNTPSIRFIIIHSPGPNWREGIPFREQPGVIEHVLHYSQLLEEGKLEIGGPFIDNSGGLMIPTDGVSKEEIEEFAAADPTVQSGLLRFEIKPWLIAMRAEEE